MSKGTLGILLLIFGMTLGFWALPLGVPFGVVFVVSFLVGLPAGALMMGAALDRWL